MATVPSDALAGDIAFNHADDEAMDSSDAYDELEDWYSASFPRIHSSPSFAHMGSAFIKTTAGETNKYTSQDCLVDSTNIHGPVDQSAYEPWADGDDYEIDVGEVDSARTDPQISAYAPESDANTATPLEVDATDPSLLQFLPKKLFTRRPAAHSPTTRCCTHCASDVNAKLLVKCATCVFRRHLYCFSPPLKQHPALAVLTTVPSHRRLPIPKLIAQWRCDDCVQRLGALSPEQSPPKLRHKSPPKQVVLNIQQQPQHRPQQAGSTRPQPFDWYAFRKAKLATLDHRDEDSEPDLVLYSPSEMLLRKTALFWRQHVERRRRLRQRHVTETTKCLVPVKRPGVNIALTPREAAEVSMIKQQNQETEDEQLRTLFDDSLYYPFDDPRPVFHTLRRRPPRKATVLLTPDELERLAVEEQGRELAEVEWMEAEDEDAPTPEQAARAAYRRAALAAADRGDPSLLGLYLAARIIDRVAVKWLERVRTRLRTTIQSREARERELMQQEERSQRQSRAQWQVRVLRGTIKFLLAMRRCVRRVQVKRDLLLALQDTAEDNRMSAEIRRELQARRRIQRFFLRRVRKHIHIRKRMMAWRIARWWKRRHYAAVFRSLAMEARSRRRESAARCIQQCYRQYSVYKTFKTIREQYVIKTLRRVLRRWLMQRVIRKEATRVAVYQAAVTITGDGKIVAPEAQLHEILRALGVALCERSDFWHAASLLERAYRIQRDGWDAAALLALAYSHHMAWYTSYDVSNLTRADEVYCGLLDGQVADVFVLQELALVRLESQEFRGALALLAKLIELFQEDDGFPLWLLLAGVVLQQVGRWEESVEYLTYLVDIALPPPYLERDMLALCAISCEHVGGGTASREAWRAAIRLWSLEKKLASVQGHYSGQYDSHGHHNEPTATLSAQRKRELLLDLAQRAYDVGHYIIVCRALLYAVERLPSSGAEGVEGQRTWWYLAESFRHLGQVELYVEATARSRLQCTDEERSQWEKEASQQASSFATELKTVRVQDLVQRIRGQYAAPATVAESEWTMEDVEMDR